MQWQSGLDVGRPYPEVHALGSRQATPGSGRFLKVLILHKTDLGSPHDGESNGEVFSKHIQD